MTFNSGCTEVQNSDIVSQKCNAALITMYFCILSHDIAIWQKMTVRYHGLRKIQLNVN